MKSIKVKYSDFPEPEEIRDEFLDIINSGKKVNASTLARYLKISKQSASEKLRKMLRLGLIQSRKARIKDIRGRSHNVVIYFKK